MNNGAFGENFPYSNFHDLNMDWIIKIAKDFLDQYSNIQQTIADGLADLETKKDEIETLLNEWYASHSEDIANQLADALEQIATNYETNITNFTNYVNAKTQEVIESIPADYSQLSQKVDNLETGDYNIINATPFTNEFYYDYDGIIHQNSAPWKSTDLIPCSNFGGVVFHLYGANPLVALISFFDSNGTWLSANPNYWMPNTAGWYDGYCRIPSDAIYFRATTQTAFTDQTPTVTLYTKTVPTDLTTVKSQGDTTMYYYDGRTYYSSPTGKFRETYYIPVSDFKVINYCGMGFNSGETQLETVTFFDGELNRISGIFPAIQPNSYAMYAGSYPIPSNAKWVKLFYNTDFDTEMISFSTVLENTHIICIGDSITLGQGGTTPYPEIMKDELGDKFTVYNAGVGGTNAATYWSTYREYLRLPTADCIIFMFGMNGGITDTFDTDVYPFDNFNNYADTITGCTCKFIEWIMQNRPDCLIIYATPTYTAAPANITETQNQIDNLPEVQELYNMPIADIRKMMCINSKNYANFLQDDKVHGNQKLYTKLGQAMANAVREYLNLP